MNTVSVIIPCYKYAHFLRECVESVLTQPYVDVRVLILDDASPDNTPEIAAKLIEKDSRIEYRRHPTNLGHIATYNEGLAWADGDYTVLLSADDLLTQGALSRAARLMDAHPEVGLVYGQALTFTVGHTLPQPNLPPGNDMWKIWNGLQWLESACKAGHVYIRSPEVVVRTSLQHRLGGYRVDLPHTADIEMWMRFAVHCAIGEVLNTDQAYYRIHRQNMHFRQVTGSLDDIRERMRAFDTVFLAYSDSIPDRKRIQDLAHRIIAREAVAAASDALDRGDALDVSVAALIDFALTTFPDTTSTPEYFGFVLRRHLGPRIYSLLQSGRKAFIASKIYSYISRHLYPNDSV